MNSIFGIDITGDGRADFLDDLIMMNIIEQSEDDGSDEYDYDEEEDDDRS